MTQAPVEEWVPTACWIGKQDCGRFSVRNGKGMGPPIPCVLKTYPVRVVEGEIQVRVAGVF
jgi:hypothetical protein